MTRNTSNIYISFSHDTDIVPIIAALGITPDKPLPWDKYADRVFWTTSVVPMGGHIVVERLHCPDPHVRVLVNGRLQSMSWDESGIYPLNDFIAQVRGKWNGTFCDACGNVDCVNDIDFFE
jgi:acid phosphatase